MLFISAKRTGLSADADVDIGAGDGWGDDELVLDEGIVIAHLKHERVQFKVGI